MSVRLNMLLALAVLLTAGGMPLHAEAPAAEDRPERLANLARDFYLAAEDGNRQLAYAVLLRIEEMASSDDLRALGNPDGWDRVDRAVAAARRALSRGREPGVWQEEAARLLLAVDALAPVREPLWLEYGRLIRDDLDRMRRAWQRGGKEGAAAAAVSLRLMKERAERLEAAAALERPLPSVRRLLDRIRYAERLLAAAETGAANRDWIEDSFRGIEQAADELFGPSAARTSAYAADKPPAAWIAALAAVLCVGLGYAGYRKYRQDRWGITPVKRP